MAGRPARRDYQKFLEYFGSQRSWSSSRDQLTLPSDPSDQTARNAAGPPPARRRIAAIFIRQMCQCLGHQRGNGGAAVDGKAFNSFQEFARQAQCDVLVIAHQKQCSAGNDVGFHVFG
jgi:hypothetical protein